MNVRVLRSYYYRSAAPAALAMMMASGAAFAETPAVQVAAADNTQVAQAAPAPQSAQNTAAAPEEIVVTGSRIVRDGYEAPTPVSVMSSDALNAIAANDIADAVNRLPALSGSVSPHNSSHSVSSGTAGVNNLNLRALNPSRTLVLLDGQRVVGSQITGFNNNGGSVDINAFPDELITRVDVVTGGASAAYGSDAVAGVVNFILDHNFTGVKGEVEGGVTTYGDDRNYKVSMTAGTGFNDDKGHFLISGNIAYNQGVRGNPRPWEDGNDWEVLTNPAYGTGAGQSTAVPAFITRPNASLADAMPGGLIDLGPLKGIFFGPGGIPQPFQYGTIAGTTMMYGGGWQSARIDEILDLDIGLARQTFFTRGSYNITDDIEVYAQLQYAQAHSTLNSVPNFELGNLTIKSDNAFIPASLRAALGSTTSFLMGTTNQDVGTLDANNVRVFRRHMVGADGKFDAMDTTWKWDTYYQESTTHLSVRAPQDVVTPQYMQAIDAVVNPATGAIVCRSTLTNPGNGCVPYDVFGTGVNSQAALNYVSATGFQSTVLDQDVEAFSLHGDPFSDWAGPVSVALGAEHRYESVYGINSALDSANAFFAGNYHASVGHFNVTEGFVESVVPLAKDAVWAKSLDLDLAARFTGYSTSGYVTTWKAGATYAPVDDIRLRATRSRDIRAPNLGDLFSAGASGTGNVTDTITSGGHVGAITTIVAPTVGNPNVQPEKADTTELGVVLQPTFLPGFQASVDYFNIDIAGAIATLSSQQTVNLCAAGNAVLCSTIQRDANGLISFITLEPQNINSQSTHGLDMQGTYRTPLAAIVDSWNGDLTLDFKGTYVFSLRSVDATGIIQGAGVDSDAISEPSVPKFRFTSSITYNLDPIETVFTVRGISAGKINNAAIACTSGCPVSTTSNPTIDYNHVNAIAYLDLALNYKLAIGDHATTLYFVTENLLNQAPPMIPGLAVAVGGTGGGGYYAGQGNATIYDRLGRMFRAGVRFKM